MIDKIHKKLMQEFPDAEIDLRDYKHDGTHMVVNIKSKKFAGLSLVDHHRLVYEALDNMMKTGELHALKIKTSP